MTQLRLGEEPPSARPPRKEWTFSQRSPVVMEQQVERCADCGDTLLIRERIVGMNWNTTMRISNRDHYEECDEKIRLRQHKPRAA